MAKIDVPTLQAEPSMWVGMWEIPGHSLFRANLVQSLKQDERFSLGEEVPATQETLNIFIIRTGKGGS